MAKKVGKLYFKGNVAFKKEKVIYKKFDKSKQIKLYGTNKKKVIDSVQQLENYTNKRNKILKRLCVVLFVVFAVGAIVFTAISDFSSGSVASLSEIWTVVSKNSYYLLFALIAFCATLLFRALTLSLMMSSISKESKLPLMIETAVIGRYYDFVTPLGAGGQPFQIYHLSKHKELPSGVAGALPLSEFVINRIAFVVLVIISLIVNAYAGFEMNITATSTIVLAIIGLVLNCFMPSIVLIFVLWPKAGEALVNLFVKIGAKLHFIKRPKAYARKTICSLKSNAKNVKMMCKNKFLVIISFVFSLASEVAVCTIAYFVLKTFAYDVEANGIMEWIQIVCTCSILYSAVSFVPTPGNAGASELSFYWVFTNCLQAGICFSAMLTWRLLSYYSYLVLGGIFILVGKIKKKNRQKLNFVEGVKTNG